MRAIRNRTIQHGIWRAIGCTIVEFITLLTSGLLGFSSAPTQARPTSNVDDCTFEQFDKDGPLAESRMPAAPSYTGGVKSGVTSTTTAKRFQTWLETGGADVRKITIPNRDGDPRRLTFAIPSGSHGLDHYVSEIVPSTVSFGYVPGWFHGEKGAPPFHAFARVGESMFHFTHDGTIHEVPYAATQGTLLNRVPKPVAKNEAPADRKRIERGNRPMTFELVFEMPDAAKSDLLRYFRDRKNGQATIGGIGMTPIYYEGGFGQFNEDGVPIENCITFALSFTQSHWSRDYPGMELVRKTANVVNQPDGDIINGKRISQLLMTSTPLAVVVLGQDSGSPDYRPEIDLLEMLRVMRHQRLKPEDITVESYGHPAPLISIPTQSTR